MTEMIRYGWAITQRKMLVAGVFALSLMTVALEGLGLALLYPLFDSVMGGEAELGGLWAFLRNLAYEITGSASVKGHLFLLLAVFFAKSVMLVAETALRAILVAKLRNDWTVEIYNYYLYSPFEKISIQSRGEIMQNLFVVPKRLAQWIITMMSIVSSIIFCITLISTLVILKWQAALIVVTSFALVALLVKLTLFGIINKKSKKLISINKGMKSIAIESILSLGMIRLFGVERKFIDRMSRKLIKLLHANLTLEVASAIPSHFGEFFVVASLAGAFLIFNIMFDMSFREAAPLLGSFAIISSRLFGRLNTVLKHRIKLESTIPWLHVAYKLIGEKQNLPRLDSGKKLREINEKIVLQDVSFGHEKGKAVLKNLSLSFPRRKLIGMVGPSGIGKTTVSHLLTRLYEPESGKILIGDTDIKEYSLKSLRRCIGYVPQNPVVLNASILENIRIGYPEASDEQVFEAAKLAGAHDFILALKHGYQTSAGDQGNRLSGGERQRVAIARAIVRQPDVLIIDEGTSALDPRAAEKIRKTIEGLARDKAVIVIAHRLEILKNADIIYEFLPNGKVATRSFGQISQTVEEVA